jgi:hypothetical protein
MKEDLILARALAISNPGARSAFLDRACADNPDVRAKIEQQIARRTPTNTAPPEDPDPANATGPFSAAQEETGPFAEATPEESQEWVFLYPVEDEAKELAFLERSATPGTLGRLGHYEVLEVIGRGGMGVVLKAHDQKLKRAVALKVMSAALADDPGARKRFVREARLAAAVTHDHIVAIHAVEEEGPVPYLVMPLIAGHSLQKEIDKHGPLPAAEVARIGLQIAEGLEAAHRHDLIHRDIKPANILLEDDSGGVKITDFGLARAGDDASITQTGQILGTPMYMSPEQAEGKKLDQRSDLFSFGSVLYALCSGRPPFRAKTTVAVLRRVCDYEPRPVRQLNPDIPRWLENVILELLEKHPADRYQTAGEVAAVLRNHVTARAKPAKPPPLPAPLPPTKAAAPRTEKVKLDARQATMIAEPAAPPSRKKPLIIGGVLCLVGLLVAAVWIVFAGTRGPDDNSIVKDDAGPGDNPIVKKDAPGQPEPGKEMPDKLVGSWKFRTQSVFAPGGEFDTVITFNKDGTYRDEVFDLQGRSGGAGTGRWKLRNGEIEKSYDAGMFQRATLTWIDNDTISLRTVETRPQNPILMGKTLQLRRHASDDNPIVKKDAPGKPEPGKGKADKLVGSWKGRWPDLLMDDVRTFNKDGSHRVEMFDRQGRFIRAQTGRWEFRDGKIHLFVAPPFVSSVETVTWIDADTIDLRVVQPPSPLQPTIRYRRHPGPINPQDQDKAQKQDQDVASQRRLAMQHACKGDWKAAAAAYARVFAVQPVADGELGFEYAAVLLLSGDRAGYRKMCSEMLQRSGSLKVRPYHVARACSLAPDSVEDAGLPAKKAELELQQNGQAFWSLTEQGALAYRAGRYNEAATLLEQSLQANDKPGRAVLNWLWLALAEHRRGKAAQARVWLGKRRSGWNSTPKASRWCRTTPRGCTCITG